MVVSSSTGDIKCLVHIYNLNMPSLFFSLCLYRRLHLVRDNTHIEIQTLYINGISDKTTLSKVSAGILQLTTDRSGQLIIHLHVDC